MHRHGDELMPPELALAFDYDLELIGALVVSAPLRKHSHQECIRVMRLVGRRAKERHRLVGRMVRPAVIVAHETGWVDVVVGHHLGHRVSPGKYRLGSILRGDVGRGQ